MISAISVFCLLASFHNYLKKKKTKQNKTKAINRKILCLDKPISSLLIWLSDLLANILLESSLFQRWRSAAKSQKQRTFLNIGACSDFW